MNLLPKDHKDFSTKEFWHEFFVKQKTQHFEWYCEYGHLSEILNRYIKVKDKILVVGCGSSKLSADLFDAGMHQSVSIDSSALVIDQMKEKYCRDRPHLVFQVMDVFELSYENESFAVVLDKGTLDALFVDESAEILGKIEKMFMQIERVLRLGGRYVCVSLLQEHILSKILDWFVNKGWFVRIHRCSKAELNEDNSIAFPVFVVVLTKVKKMENPAMILEIVHDGLSAPKRCSLKEEAIDYIRSTQHCAFLRHYIHKKKLIQGEDVCLELYCPDTSQVKYRLFVVDREEPSALEFAIFIVPQGREVEWLFCSAEGRRELVANANSGRLVVVHLLRSSVHNSLEQVKKDLSEKVMELAPPQCKAQVPILSLGEDVGTREIRCTSRSAMSGEYVVEDVASTDNHLFRRLIFLSNPYLVQSEAKLLARSKKGSKIDFEHLACDHHKAILSGLAFLESRMLSPKVALIGLGGGSLAMYLHKRLPDAEIEAVELDPEIVSVAKKWFNLTVDDRLKVHVEDGVHFMEEAARRGRTYDAVIVDVDSKDSSLGMSSPPAAFLEDPVLEALARVVGDSGVAILNVACRNKNLEEDVHCRLKGSFGSVFCNRIPEQVNEVVYCLKGGSVDMSSVEGRFASLLSFLDKPFDLMSTLSKIK